MILSLPRLQTPLRMLNELRLSGEMSSLAVEIDSGLGFFAQLNWCLYILAYCEEHELRPRIRLTGTSYAETPNRDWFHEFFEEIEENEITATVRWTTGDEQETSLYVRHINETNFASLYAPSMTIEWAHQLFTTRYGIQPQIESYVNEFVAREFAESGTLGLHFRGTDKKTEAKPVDWPRCFRSVIKYATDHPDVRSVFISSDDPHFIDWFAQEAEGMLTVISHPDEERSRDGRAVHVGRMGNGRRKGFEALVNCLLLSRCIALIRTASFLSGWSSVFNPNLPITLLNEPYEQTRWFPDRELILRSDNRYR
jgi:hypothetical protein